MKPSFLDAYPNLKKHWDYEKNNKLGIYPENCRAKSHKKVWWKCDVKLCHEWFACISGKTETYYTDSTNCKFCNERCTCICPTDACNSLFYNARFEVIKQQWDEKENGSAKLYMPQSNIKVRWICDIMPCHVWYTSLDTRIGLQQNCPCCANKKICPTDACNSVEHNEKFTAIHREEWDYEKNGDPSDHFPNSKVHWICRKKPESHRWCCTIDRRLRGDNCPKCKDSKLEENFSEATKELEITGTPQKRFLDCRDKYPLPFDHSFSYKNKEVLVEMQGIQHFHSESYYNKKNVPFYLRISHDNYKSWYANKYYSFLSISYLCIENVGEILKNFLKSTENDTISRYYITPKKYLEYKKPGEIFSNILEDDLKSDKFFSIYQMFNLNINSIKHYRKIQETDLTFCETCESSYLTETIKMHYQTDDHFKTLRKIYKETFVGMCPDSGWPIVREK